MDALAQYFTSTSSEATEDTESWHSHDYSDDDYDYYRDGPPGPPPRVPNQLFRGKTFAVVDELFRPHELWLIENMITIHGGDVRADTTGASYIVVPCHWQTTDLAVWSTAIKLWRGLPLVTSQWIEVCLMSAHLYPVEGRLAELLFRPLSSEMAFARTLALESSASALRKRTEKLDQVLRRIQYRRARLLTEETEASLHQEAAKRSEPPAAATNEPTILGRDESLDQSTAGGAEWLGLQIGHVSWTLPRAAVKLTPIPLSSLFSAPWPPPPPGLFTPGGDRVRAPPGVDIDVTSQSVAESPEAEAEAVESVEPEADTVKPEAAATAVDKSVKGPVKQSTKQNVKEDVEGVPQGVKEPVADNSTEVVNKFTKKKDRRKAIKKATKKILKQSAKENTQVAAKQGVKPPATEPASTPKPAPPPPRTMSYAAATRSAATPPPPRQPSQTTHTSPPPLQITPDRPASPTATAVQKRPVARRERPAWMKGIDTLGLRIKHLVGNWDSAESSSSGWSRESTPLAEVDDTNPSEEPTMVTASDVASRDEPTTDIANGTEVEEPADAGQAPNIELPLGEPILPIEAPLDEPPQAEEVEGVVNEDTIDTTPIEPEAIIANDDKPASEPALDTADYERYVEQEAATVNCTVETPTEEDDNTEETPAAPNIEACPKEGPPLLIPTIRVKPHQPTEDDVAQETATDLEEEEDPAAVAEREAALEAERRAKRIASNKKKKQRQKETKAVAKRKEEEDQCHCAATAAQFMMVVLCPIPATDADTLGQWFSGPSGYRTAALVNSCPMYRRVAWMDFAATLAFTGDEPVQVEVMNAFLGSLGDKVQRHGVCIETSLFWSTLKNKWPRGLTDTERNNMVTKWDQSRRIIVPLYHRGYWGLFCMDLEARRTVIFDPSNLDRQPDNPLVMAVGILTETICGNARYHDAFIKSGAQPRFLKPRRPVHHRYSAILVAAACELLVYWDTGNVDILSTLFASLGELLGAEPQRAEITQRLSQLENHAELHLDACPPAKRTASCVAAVTTPRAPPLLEPHPARGMLANLLARVAWGAATGRTHMTSPAEWMLQKSSQLKGIEVPGKVDF